MEIAIVKFFNRLGGEKWDKITDVVSRVKFLVVFWLIIIFGFFVFDGKLGKEIFIATAAALVLHFLITELLIKTIASKIFGKRKRPYQAHEKEIRVIGRMFTDSSFPSSHMASLLAILSVMVYFHPNFLIIAILILMLMAYSRMHNGMHYLSDVLACVQSNGE